jgi:hypothetical protein
VKTLGLILIFKRQKHSTACLFLTYTDRDIGYREVEALRDPRWSYGIIYKDYTDKPLAGLILDYH